MLDGIRVLDLAGEALAYTGRVFAGLGADVILVEPPAGAPARSVPPLVRSESGHHVSAYFAFMGAGKRSVTLDDSTDAGRALLERLVGVADIVLLPDDARAARERGLDADALLALNPRVVVISVTGFGLTGPRRGWRGADLVAWAASGAALSTGDADRPPIAPGGGLAYAAGALNAAVGAMLALRARQRTGRGQLVDISLQEAAMSVSMEAGLLHSLEGRAQRRGARRNAAHGLYRVQDGYVEVVAYLPAQWEAIAGWIEEELGIAEAGLDTFRGEPMNRQPFIDLIDAWVGDLASRYTKQAFFLEAQRRRIPCGPVNDANDVIQDPHLEAVGAWGKISHPDAGTVKTLREPVKFDGVPLRVGDVPALGADNEAIFEELGQSSVRS
jgi:crotonobetainyl-CoA:carnitine CoA-transferase CaiB-like acyl-CoA transferase